MNCDSIKAALQSDSNDLVRTLHVDEFKYLTMKLESHYDNLLKLLLLRIHLRFVYNVILDREELKHTICCLIVYFVMSDEDEKLNFSLTSRKLVLARPIRVGQTYDMYR